MSYFKIGENDYSQFVNILSITDDPTYDQQINAAGDSVVDYITRKRTFDVGFIPLDPDAMIQLQADLDAFHVKVSFLNPKTNQLETNVDCIATGSRVDYYTIQKNRVLYKPFSIQLVEL